MCACSTITLQCAAKMLLQLFAILDVTELPTCVCMCDGHAGCRSCQPQLERCLASGSCSCHTTSCKSCLPASCRCSSCTHCMQVCIGALCCVFSARQTGCCVCQRRSLCLTPNNPHCPCSSLPILLAQTTTSCFSCLRPSAISAPASPACTCSTTSWDSSSSSCKTSVFNSSLASPV